MWSYARLSEESTASIISDRVLITGIDATAKVIIVGNIGYK